MPPPTAERLKIRCYRCNQLLAVAPSKAGTVVACPKCKADLLIPRPEPQPPADGAGGPRGRPARSRGPSRPWRPSGVRDDRGPGGGGLAVVPRRDRGAHPARGRRTAAGGLAGRGRGLRRRYPPAEPGSARGGSVRVPGDLSAADRLPRPRPSSRPPPRRRTSRPPWLLGSRRTGRPRRPSPPLRRCRSPRPRPEPKSSSRRSASSRRRSDRPSTPSRGASARSCCPRRSCSPGRSSCSSAIPMAFLAGLMIGHFLWRIGP